MRKNTPRRIHDDPTRKVTRTPLDIARLFIAADEEEKREEAKRLAVENKISFC